MSWPKKKLGDLVTVGRGSSPRPIKDEKYFIGGDIPWVKIADATASGKYIYKTKQFLNDYGASFSRKLKPGSLIFPASGTLGNPKFLGIEACIHDGWLYFTDFKSIDPDWLYYKLITIKDYYLGIAYGAAIQNINTAIVRNTEIELPTLKEQSLIANILTTYDELIETNQRRIQLQEEAARRLYREWFVRLRFPGYEEVSVVDGIPEGWQSGFAHEFLDVMSGGTPKTSIENYWNGDIPFFTPKDAPDGIYVTKTEKNITEDGLSKCNSKLYPKETVFITARGTVGKLALAQCPMAMNQSCYAIKTKENLGVNNLWMFLAVQSAVEHFKQAASEGVFRSIVVNTFKTIPLICPSPAITHQFGDLLRPLFDQVETLMLQNSRLKLARDQLLPKLMSGQLDISRIKIESPVVESG